MSSRAQASTLHSIEVYDLLLNLLSEGIGIAVTVLLIDRIIKHREKRTWRPAESVMHRRVLTQIIDPFLAKGEVIERNIMYKSPDPMIVKKFVGIQKLTLDQSIDLLWDTQGLAEPTKRRLRDEFDVSAPLLGSELSNILQLFDEQLGEVLKVDFARPANLANLDSAEYQALLMATYEKLATFKSAVRTARWAKAWLEARLKQS
jgi:hypothetical protein